MRREVYGFAEDNISESRIIVELTNVPDGIKEYKVIEKLMHNFRGSLWDGVTEKSEWGDYLAEHLKKYGIKVRYLIPTYFYYFGPRRLERRVDGTIEHLARV